MNVPQIPDTDRGEILEAITHVIECGRPESVTLRIPVWCDNHLVAWYNVDIQREPHTPV